MAENRIVNGLKVCPLCNRTLPDSQIVCGLARKLQNGMLAHKTCAEFPQFAGTIGRKDWDIHD